MCNSFFANQNANNLLWIFHLSTFFNANKTILILNFPVKKLIAFFQNMTRKLAANWNQTAILMKSFFSYFSTQQDSNNRDTFLGCFSRFLDKTQQLQHISLSSTKILTACVESKRISRVGSERVGGGSSGVARPVFSRPSTKTKTSLLLNLKVVCVSL